MSDIAAATWSCSVARTVEVVGERWTMLILREAFLGVRRFDAMPARPRHRRNILSDRLGKLVEHGSSTGAATRSAPSASSTA